MQTIIDANNKDYLEEFRSKDIMIKDFRKLNAYKLSLEFYKGYLDIIDKLPKCE